MTSMRLAASYGVESHRLQRPSIRAGAHARHLILSASVDASRKAQRRRPHLYDGVLGRPRISAGRLHQHHSRGVTRHGQRVYPSLSTAPAGNMPVSRKRQSAMSNLRATATIPIRRKRLPPLPKRSRNHTLRALSPRFKGSECPCHFFGLRTFHTTRRRDRAHHRLTGDRVGSQRSA